MEPDYECYYFGCWNEAGHYLFALDGNRLFSRKYDRVIYFGNYIHLDGRLAPRIDKHGSIVWAGKGNTTLACNKLTYSTSECPQGQFLLHFLDNGFTAIQWWDRCQGDHRGACNSTILMEGKHTSAEMLDALERYFPRVLSNLKRSGVELVEIKPTG